MATYSINYVVLFTLEPCGLTRTIGRPLRLDSKSYSLIIQAEKSERTSTLIDHMDFKRINFPIHVLILI